MAFEALVGTCPDCPEFRYVYIGRARAETEGKLEELHLVPLRSTVLTAMDVCAIIMGSDDKMLYFSDEKVL